MKLKIVNKEGSEKGSVELPNNFSSQIRPDVLQRIFEAQKRKQPMGSKYGAGAGYSASGILRHKRHAWKTTYGKGISRIPRKIMSRHGVSFNWIGATIASARGGRRAHPPKAEENQFKKVNKKELIIAYNTGFSATLDKKIIEEKYGILFEPVAFDSSVLKLKTKEFFELLKKIFKDNKEKLLQNKKIRSGKGKARGRKYKRTSGLLFVVSSKEDMKRKGIDVIRVNELKIKNLSPDGRPGRLACYSEEAIKEIGEKFK